VEKTKKRRRREEVRKKGTGEAREDI